MIKVAMYVLTHIESGSYYVGVSSSPKSRSLDHKNLRGDQPFHEEIRKYGWDAFNFEVVQWFDSPEEAGKAEIDRIALGKQLGHSVLNKDPGGDCASEETRLKQSLSHKGKVPWNYGKSITEEHRKSLSESHIGVNLGKKRTDESKARISLAKTGKPRAAHTLESKAKIAEGVRKYWEKRKSEKELVEWFCGVLRGDIPF